MKVIYKEGDIVLDKNQNRNYIKIGGKLISNAIYVAKNNPEICGEWFEGAECHHINYNSSDDRPNNIVVLTSEEHHKIHSKSIDVFFKNKYIGRFPSMTEASKKLNITIPSISYYIKNQKPISSTYTDYRFAKCK